MPKSKSAITRKNHQRYLKAVYQEVEEITFPWDTDWDWAEISHYAIVFRFEYLGHALSLIHNGHTQRLTDEDRAYLFNKAKKQIEAYRRGVRRRQKQRGEKKEAKEAQRGDPRQFKLFE